MATARDKPSEWWLVKLDERYAWGDATVLERTQANWGVYAFDRTEHTYLCSMTPCYAFYFIANEYDEAEGLTDEEREELNELVLSVINDEPVRYFQVWEIEALLEAQKDRVRHVEIEPDEPPVDQIAEGWGTGALMF